MMDLLAPPKGVTLAAPDRPRKQVQQEEIDAPLNADEREAALERQKARAGRSGGRYATARPGVGGGGMVMPMSAHGPGYSARVPRPMSPSKAARAAAATARREDEARARKEAERAHKERRAEFFPGRAYGIAVTLFHTGAPAGGVISGLTVGPILSTASSVGLEGWRWIFIAQAMPGLFIAPLIACVLPPHPQALRRTGALCLPPDALRELQMVHMSHRSQGLPVPFLRLVTTVVSRPLSWCFGILAFATQTSAYAGAFFSTLLTQQTLKAAGVSVEIWHIGLIFIAPTLLSVVLGPPFVGWACRTRRRYAGLSVVAASVVLFYTVAALLLRFATVPGARVAQASASDTVDQESAPRPAALCAAAALVCFMAAAFVGTTAFGILFSLHASVTRGDLLPVSTAFVNMIGNFGGFLGPVLLGWAHDSLGPFCEHGDASVKGGVDARGGRNGTHGDGHAICPSQYAWGVHLLAAVYGLMCVVALLWAHRLGVRG